MKIWVRWGESDTIDGRNPAPVEVGSLSHYLQGLCIPGDAGFLPSTVEVVEFEGDEEKKTYQSRRFS